MATLLLLAQGASLPDADRAYAAGRYAEAAGEYRRLLESAPGEPGLLLRLAAAEYQLGDYAAAERHFRGVLEKAEAPPALVGLGTTLLMLGRFDEAIPPLERALELTPEDVQVRRALGRAYAEEGMFVEGEATLSKLLEEDPSDWQSWYFLGALFFDQNYHQPALDALEKSLALHPDNPTAHVYRAGSLSQLGRADEAEQAFNELARDPRLADSTERLLGHAQLLFRTERYDQALQLINRAVEVDPHSAKLRFWKARLLYHSGEIKAALAEAEQAVALSPETPNARNLLLKLYRVLGREEEAAQQAAWLRKYENRIALGKPR